MQRIRNRRSVLVRCAFAAVLLAVPVSVEAQAYCALRDPTRTLNEMYPDGTGQRTIVRTVGNAARREVARSLPFELHFNELGRHTLYAVLDEKEPIGLVRVRAEQGKWGLVEVAWSLDLDLRLTDFRFQRCRETGRDLVEAEDFRTQLIGLGVDDLRTLVNEDGSALQPGRLAIPVGADELVLTLLRSAMKAQIVTAAVWKSELAELRMLTQAHAAFPGFADTETVEQAFDPAVFEARRLASLHTPSKTTQDATAVLRVLDSEGEPLGLVIHTLSAVGQLSIRTTWSVDRSGVIVDVRAHPDWPTKPIDEAFAELIGLSGNDLGECLAAVQVAGVEVLALWHVHLERD